MSSFFVSVLFFGTAVLAKGGASSGSSSGGGSSLSSSGEGSDAQAFVWTPYSLFQLILAITFGVFTLFGGGYWLIKRYNPAAKAAGSTTLLWTTWITWVLSIAFYIFAAISAAVFAMVRGDGSDFNRLFVAWVAPAFENTATAGWMMVILGHAYAMWRTSEVEVKHPGRTKFLFYLTFTFLVILAVLGGIVGPATMYNWVGSNRLSGTVDAIQNAYVRLASVTASILFSTVLVIRRTTRRIEGFKSLDPLRWIICTVIPIWIIIELARVILEIVAGHGDYLNSELLYMTRFHLSTVPSIAMFGIASLATITALPYAVASSHRSKEVGV